MRWMWISTPVTRHFVRTRSELATQEPNVARAIGESNDTYIRLQQEQLARLEVQRDFVLSQNPTLVSQASSSVPLKDVEAQIAALRKNLQSRTKSYLSTLSPSDRSGGATKEVLLFLPR